MLKNWSSKVQEILKIGKPLINIGINNWALTKQQAIEAIELLYFANIPLYGGDVFEFDGSIFRSNYDNWYCNPLTEETENEFLNRSITISKNYILSYSVNDTKRIFFVLVPKN